MRCFLTFLSSLLIVWVIIPPIIKVTSQSKMFDEPTESRKVHKLVIPNAGGIAIFIGFLFSCLVFIPFNLLPQANVLMAAALIVFVMGLKDDMDGLAPYKKFVAQLVAACITAIIGDLRITDFYGILGINELPYIVSVLFTVFFIVGVVNAFNLIDGIDGLAGSIGVLVAFFFTFLFLHADQFGYAYLSVAVAGSLVGFLRFNITPARIFMGDSGALLLGFIVAVLSIRLSNGDIMNSLELGPLRAEAGYGLILSILIIPVFDTIRIFSIRIIQRRSPFSADNNHIHHRLLLLGLNHTQSTSVLVLCNILFLVLATLSQPLGNTWVLVIITSLALIFNSILTLMIKYAGSKAIIKKGIRI